MFDGVDTKILTILQSNARTSHAEIARRVGVTAPAVLERVRKLEKAGVIQGYTAVLDPAALGRPLLAYVFVRIRPHRALKTVGPRLSALPEVLELAHLAGEECLMVKVRCAGPVDLEEVVMRINDVEQVYATRTVLAFRTLKETAAPAAAPGG